MTRRISTLLVLAIMGLAVGTAWWMGHTQDDAFITFRYSQHLAEGHGPVYNPGEAVEGYSNFLWMLIMAVPIGLGFDPVTPSWLLSLLCMAANLWLCYRLFDEFLRCHKRGVLMVLILASNFTFLAFGTSGLETSLNALLWTAVMLVTMRILAREPTSTGQKTWIGLGLLYALVLLSRPDGVVLIAVSSAFILLHLKFSSALKVSQLLSVVLPFLIPVTIWLIWKYSFYGNLLPNTFYAKGGGWHFYDSLQYLGEFALTYLLIVPGIWMLMRYRDVLSDLTRPMAFVWALIVGWMLYLFVIGGDFMEFRMLVPIMPALYLVIGSFLFFKVKHAGLRYGVLGLLLLANVLHGPMFGRLYATYPVIPVVPARVERPVAMLDYMSQGKALRALVGPAKDLHLAIGGAGALPYYAGYRVTDLFGLMSPAIAREGIQVNWGPGHNKFACMSQLNEAGVHLLILRCDPGAALPRLSELLSADKGLRAMQANAQTSWTLEQLTYVSLDLGNGHFLSGVYLRPHPRLELLLETGDIQRIEIK